MECVINLYSETPGQIQKFLELFYSTNVKLDDNLFWGKSYQNPIDMIEFISCFIDNHEKFKINLWVSIDNGIFINVTEENIDELIKYIYERFPDI